VYSFNKENSDLPIPRNINEDIPIYPDVFLYYKVSNYVPKFGTNILNIVLKHKFSQVKFVLDMRYLTDAQGSYKMMDKSKLLSIHSKYGKINLNTGNFTGYGGLEDVPVPMKCVSEKLYESDYIPITLESYDNKKIMFSGEMIAPSKNGGEKK